MTGRPALRIGTRASALALAQATIVATALRGAGVETEFITITTAGDRRAVDTPWGEGAFVRAIEDALLEGAIDIAVHSAKDVPTEEHPRLQIGAFLPRATPLDALVLRAGTHGSLDDLAPATTIGTDSPRRRGFILARRPDLDVRPLHGNVDTRLRKLDEGEVDALVLAAAGLERLGRTDRISELLPVTVVPPAPGQGAIAAQARSDDATALQALDSIDHPPTRAAVEAERAFLEATGGGCRAPVGALAEVNGDVMTVTAGFATLDGQSSGLETEAGPASEGAALGRKVAELIVERRGRLPGRPRVLVTRPAAEARRLGARLAELNLAPVIVPTIEIELLNGGPVREALESLRGFDWAVATSANAARALRAGNAGGQSLDGVRWAAVGPATARELAFAGVVSAWQPSDANGATLASELPFERGERVLWLRGDLADDSLIEALRARGADVDAVTVYRTLEAPSSSVPLLAAALSPEPPDAVVFGSPSAVRGLITLVGEGHSRLLAIPAVCVGPTTASAARAAGFAVVAEADSRQASALAELTATHLLGVPA